MIHMMTIFELIYEGHCLDYIALVLPDVEIAITAIRSSSLCFFIIRTFRAAIFGIDLITPPENRPICCCVFIFATINKKNDSVFSYRAVSSFFFSCVIQEKAWRSEILFFFYFSAIILRKPQLNLDYLYRWRLKVV